MSYRNRNVKRRWNLSSVAALAMAEMVSEAGKAALSLAAVEPRDPADQDELHPRSLFSERNYGGNASIQEGQVSTLQRQSV